MFQPRSNEFDPRVSAIVDHLHAIEKELSAIGKIAGRRASSGAPTTANQVVGAIVPILRDLTDRVRRGQQAALAEAKGVGTEAIKAGARVGNDALDQLGDQAKQRPLFTMAVALGIGMLIGFATRWNWRE
jgi:hypothetical protein